MDGQLCRRGEVFKKSIECSCWSEGFLSFYVTEVCFIIEKREMDAQDILSKVGEKWVDWNRMIESVKKVNRILDQQFVKNPRISGR
jgi:hypothetical protein